MAGSTDTSLWTHYQRGVRNYCGNPLPEGMRKNDRWASLALEVTRPNTFSTKPGMPP